MNGWQRLWVVAAVVWLPLAWQFDGSSPWGVVGAAVYVIPVGVLYMCGVAIAWVRRGFLQSIPR